MKASYFIKKGRIYKVHKVSKPFSEKASFQTNPEDVYEILGDRFRNLQEILEKGKCWADDNER